MPSNINELIENYVAIRHQEGNLKHRAALREIVLYRMGIESTKIPLGSDNRFSSLQSLCEKNRGSIEPIDVKLIEECEKIGRDHKLSDSMVYGSRITSKVNAFALKQIECQKHNKPFVLKIDMNKVDRLDDDAFKSLIYCIQQFKPNLSISHLFANDNNKPESEFISALPEGLNLRIHGLQAHMLLVERTMLLFKVIANAKSLSLDHCELGRWTTDDIQAFCNTLMQNQHLEALNLQHNDLYRWADPSHSEKLEALATMIKKTGLKDVNIDNNGFDKLTKEERASLRTVISEALENGLCRIHAPRTLVSPGFLGFFKYVFSHPDRGNCPEPENLEEDVSSVAPN